ncbi:MAG: response regulator [Candidatus Aminicenantes bacterium]|nr:MAG: response regulator [Candidatus Aminicenantes bacterium]
MKTDVNILIADDDPGHVNLIRKNLRRSGIFNPIIHFKDGQEVLDFLFNLNKTNPGPQKTPDSYLLLLDIRMPKVDGVEVLRRLKAHPELKKIPVIILSTTDDPMDIEKCHYLGCSTYITKPVKYDRFVESIRKLALFLKVIEVPFIKNNKREGSTKSKDK